MPNDLVLVTGGSGFIAAHCIIRLLKAGYQVRTTVRSPSRQIEVRKMLRAGSADLDENSDDRLQFATVDLLADTGWADAAAGCRYMLHVASPLPMSEPKNENDLIIPAREGAVRAMRAARDAGVSRVVLTSSFAAIGYGQPVGEKPFDESSWTNVDGPGVSAYAKSKTLAERAAWDFISKEGGSLELATVNPVAVFGPVLGPDFSISIEIIAKMMNGSLPGCPRIFFGAVDVRDIADLHLLAMTDPVASGQRFLATAGDFIPCIAVATALRRHMGAAARRVPTRQLPDWLIRLSALIDARSKMIVSELGKQKNGTSEKARRLLGWLPRSSEDSIIATAQSLLDLGLLKR